MLRKYRSIFFLIPIAWLCSGYQTFAEPEFNSAGDNTTFQPKVCLAFNPETNSWGSIGTVDNSSSFGFCPRGSAYLGVDRVGNPDRAGSEVPVNGFCCPLPEDALEDYHEFASDSCSANFVATGSISGAELYHPECTSSPLPQHCESLLKAKLRYLRCTKINTTRYQLSAFKQAYSWGWARHLSGRFGARLLKTQIPIGIRHAAGRLSRTQWAMEGCIGRPIGSLLVGKQSRRCSGFIFSELQYRGIKGDPRSGTSVKLIPDCTTISDRLNPNAFCIR